MPYEAFRIISIGINKRPLRLPPTAFEQGVAMQGWSNAVTDSFSSSENTVQKQLGHSLRVSFKRANSALLDLERASVTALHDYFHHAPSIGCSALSPFKFSLSDHVLTWIGINSLVFTLNLIGTLSGCIFVTAVSTTGTFVGGAIDLVDAVSADILTIRSRSGKVRNGMNTNKIKNINDKPR